MDMTDIGSYTPREYYRLHGRLPERTIEALIDTSEDVESLPDVAPYISEASGQFPEEDFLGEAIEQVQDLAKKLRGDNRETAREIAVMLENIQQTITGGTEYGREQLRNALKELEQANGAN